MTEPVFKSPLPPQNGGFTPSTQNKEAEQKLNSKVNSIQDIKQKIWPYFWYALGGVFLFGLILGVAMSGEESVPAAPECRLRHIPNPDIQGRFPLCGLTTPSEPCILYIMNTDRYEHYSEDYFREAGRLTGRADVNISVENAVYSKLLIPPGWFAEIKIPSQR